MVPALVLTEEKAAERGYTGPGPHTLGGVFPGTWFVGEPVAVSELGFDTPEEAFAAAEDANAPLEQTTVADGEGKVHRRNHALGELEAQAAAVDAAIEEKAGGRIATHAEADDVASALGIEFPEGTKLDEKKAAIETVRGGEPVAAVEQALQDEHAPDQRDEGEAV